MRDITSKCLTTQLHINPTTVSQWCNNSSLPDIFTLLKIAHLLDWDVNDLYRDDVIRQYSVFIE